MLNWIWRLKSLIERKRNMVERTEELQFHLDMEVQQGLRMGLSESEARRRARLRAGLLSEGIESTHEQLGLRWLDGAAADLRHAVRSLTRNKGFGAVAVLVLASSVAINTLIFCMLQGVVLQPLPYRSPEQLVRVYDSGKDNSKFAISISHFLDFQANAKTIESIALYTGRDVELSGVAGTESRQLSGLRITPDYFTVLGKPLARGRAFANDDMRTKNRNAIISYRLWQREFQSDPAIIGRTIRLDREPWTVVGVAPEDFEHVGGEYRSPLQGETVDIWVPLPLDLGDVPSGAWHFCNAIARIRPGVTVSQAREELTRLAALYAQHYPNYGTWSVRVEPLLSEVTGRSSDLVWLLAAAGGLVLLVACANIAGLSMARAVARRGELALRHALGASRWQLARVGLAENLLAGFGGAIVGLGLARIGLPLLHQLLPADFPRAHAIVMSWEAALFAVSIAIATVVIAGLLPSAGRTETLESQRATAGRESRRLRFTLVAGEVALAGLLCAGALFLLRSYQEIGARDHGFRADGALTFRLTLQAGADPKQADFTRLYDSISAKIREIPGVTAVGASTNLPWSGYDENTSFGIVGRVEDKTDEPGARYQAATPGYFEAAGMRLISGRFFDWTHEALGQPLTLIVNDALARRYFGDRDPVGAMVDLAGKNRQIVGVVAGIRDHPADFTVKPAFWFPATQQPFPDIFFVVRTRDGVDPTGLTAPVAAAVHSVDPQLPLAEVRTLEHRAAAALASRRFALWLFQSFAALALVLAAAGIYGLLAYIVQQRRKELSVRMALGASRSDLWRMVLGDGMRMASSGVVICLILVPVGGYLLRTFLFQVRAFDPLTIAGVTSALLLAALFASLGPAWSAMRSDPAQALREE
ncbi:MAG TPA: ABC transporter permease [Bryobacteraceae bacterium]|jgi:predicted permease